MTNTLAKSTILILLLFLSGCAHHSGYYAGRSHIGSVGVSVGRYTPVYHDYYDHDVYLRQPSRNNYKAYKPAYDKHYYDKHQHGGSYKRNRSFNKSYSKREHRKNDRGYGHKRKWKGEREHVSRRDRHASNDKHQHGRGYKRNRSFNKSYSKREHRKNDGDYGHKRKWRGEGERVSRRDRHASNHGGYRSR